MDENASEMADSIVTREYAATGHTPHRVIAKRAGERSIALWRDNMSDFANHFRAASALAVRQHLNGQWLVGRVWHGYVFVAAEGSRIVNIIPFG
jgi:hypothetical protein